MVDYFRREMTESREVNNHTNIQILYHECLYRNISKYSRNKLLLTWDLKQIKHFGYSLYMNHVFRANRSSVIWAHRSFYVSERASLSLRLVGFSTLLSNFFDKFWKHATLLIILWFRSNFRTEFVRCISFLREKTELIYLHYSPFYIYLCTGVKICAKKVPNVVLTVKNRIFIF